MVTYSDEKLDKIFGALADRTRRELLRRIGERSQPVKELAEPFGMSRPAISKHLKLLEDAGLIRRDRDGRLHQCSPRPHGFRAANDWLSEMEVFWENQLDRFQRYLESTPEESGGGQEESPPSEDDGKSA